jgi:hypothetical protein
MRMRAAAVLSAPVLALLAGCSPEAVGRAVSERTAATVVYPVGNQVLPGPQAEAATDCITAAATQAQLEALMRDVGTRAGTLTVQNVRTIAASPEAQSCLAARGLPALPA